MPLPLARSSTTAPGVPTSRTACRNAVIRALSDRYSRCSSTISDTGGSQAHRHVEADAFAHRAERTLRELGHRSVLDELRPPVRQLLLLRGSLALAFRVVV